jgi:tripartite-type tricarboxylate transporter receptor subunit TctC
MKLARLLLALCAMPLAAMAQDFPSRPITIVVPLAPGSASDIMARAIGQRLQASLGQSVVIDNRPGASTTVGAAFTARAPSDGHTLLMAAPPVLITPMFMPNAGYDPMQDLKPLSLVAYYPLVMVVHPSVPANNLSELVGWARANPGRSYPSPGAGSPVHLVGALMAREAGLNLVHVSYRGGAQGVTDLIAGIVHFYPGPTIEVMQNIQSGRLRAITLLGERRAPLLPEIGTSAEQGFPTLTGSIWSVMMAPNGTPAPIMARLSREIAAAVATPEFRERLMAQGAELVGSNQAEAEAFLRAEDARWRPLVRELGITIGD